MEYIELKIKVDKVHLEETEDLLTGSGFSSMMIDDPDDIRDIEAHPDLYRYDYINEALTEDLDRSPVITLFFADDEGEIYRECICSFGFDNGNVCNILSCLRFRETVLYRALAYEYKIHR